MEKDQKVASEDPKVDLFEDDDEFEEFNINQGNCVPMFLLISNNLFRYLLVSLYSLATCSMIVSH